MTYADRLETIRAELERRAKDRRTIRYGELAAMVGLVAQGLGSYLNTLRAQEAERNRPDLGCLVINKATDFPGYVKTETDRVNALRVREAVFAAWA